MDNHAFILWADQARQAVENTLAERLAVHNGLAHSLYEAMRYTTLGGGKRLRALLVMASGEVVQAPEATLLPMAAAVEMVHAYSLVHDDMPCMDDDDLRRGKPSCHKAYDEATALLVGDALQSLAFETLSMPMLHLDCPSRQIAMIRLLSEAIGRMGMVGGQAIDGNSVGKDLTIAELEFMHILKTGALIRASVQLGAMAGRTLSNEEQHALDAFAKAIGLAFQVVDDVLDHEADTATLGKNAGSDAAKHKPTYVSLLGITQAKALAITLLQDAQEALRPFGDSAKTLKTLAYHMVARPC